MVERSGLRGRGGADFPTAVKLRTVAGAGRATTVVVNGSETEPASAKDRLLMARLPHLVLDGAILAARAIGAGEIIIKIGDGAPTVARALEGAIAVRPETDVKIQVVAGPEGYVVGEETRGPALPVQGRAPSRRSCPRGRSSAACAGARR